MLAVDDDSDLRELLSEELPRRGFAARVVEGAAQALAALASEEFDVVVTDLNMPGMDGLALCARLREVRPGVPVVVMTAFGSMDAAISAIRAGAYDFVTKPVELDALAIALARAAEHRALEARVRALSREVEVSRRLDDLLGESPPMQRLFRLIERLAPSDASVLIVGESGTGKELVARALHHRGPRAAGPFVAINSAAMPETLLESELFGHARGAFTDARAERRGLIEQADGGTLLLDEIGDMPAGIQAKLLRVLEQRSVRPLGSEREIAVNVRVLAATHRDLEALVEEGRFREDLYFRIHVVRLDVPPLHERGNDVLLLAQDFLERIAARAVAPARRLSRAAAEKLLAYAWPGNVRELRNAIEHAVALCAGEEIGVDDLPDRVRAYRADSFVLAGPGSDELVSLAEVERRYVRHVVERVGGNRTQAARILGLDRKTLRRKLGAED